MFTTAPTYRGHVSDGWHYADGRIVYTVPPLPTRYDASRDPRRLRLKILAGDVDAMVDDILDGGEVPGISAAAVAGQQQPRASQVLFAKQALRRLPRVFLKAVFSSGKRIELVSGVDAARHPDFHRKDKPRGIANERLAAVAADANDFQATVLHEFAHLLDNVLDRQAISHDPRWRSIWKAEVTAGRVECFADQRIFPFEYFAESFARYWLSDASRCKLSGEVQVFMAELPQWFH